MATEISRPGLYRRPGDRGMTELQGAEKISEIMSREAEPSEAPQDPDGGANPFDRFETKDVEVKQRSRRTAADVEDTSRKVDEAAENFAAQEMEPLPEAAPQFEAEPATELSMPEGPPPAPKTPEEFSRTRAELNSQIQQFEYIRDSINWAELDAEQTQEASKQLRKSAQWLATQAQKLNQAEAAYTHSATQAHIQTQLNKRNEALVASFPELEDPQVQQDVLTWLKNEQGYTDQDLSVANWHQWDYARCAKVYNQYKKSRRVQAKVQPTKTIKLKKTQPKAKPKAQSEVTFDRPKNMGNNGRPGRSLNQTAELFSSSGGSYHHGGSGNPFARFSRG